ncbi:DUF4192 domain-containing protein [Actinoplanes sp. NPDC051859]|uniref:DUF4192 domain-containing protein n=1 Tax=Actinoplanes sp. NPDC051859 TaxID=3363909 RepID=UPI0037B095C2
MNQPAHPGEPTGGAAVTARTMNDVLAAVAVGLGYHPHHQVVMVGVRNRKVDFVSATMLGEPGTDGDEPPQLRVMVHEAVRAAASAVFVIGYGQPAAVEPALQAAAVLCRRHSLDVIDLMRVTDGRVVSLGCTDARCCPPEGTTVDLAASPVTATAVAQGLVARSSRAALMASIAPRDGEQPAMRAACARASHRVLLLADTQGLDGVQRAADAAIAAAVTRYRDGGRLDDDELAWLTVHLLTEQARLSGLRSINPRDPWHVELWSDVSRRCLEGVVAGPATLLAFASWLSGNHVLAKEAVARALQTDPGFPLATVLARLLADGVSAREDELRFHTWRRAGGEPRREGV